MITLTKLRPYTRDVVAPSPNHDARQAQVIEGIVLHATQDAGHEARSLAWMRSPKSRVSCHLLVSRGGRVTRLVGDQQRAWHAGVSWWRGTSDVNSITLGIEIANRNDGEPYTEAQYRRVAEVVANYCRQGLTLDDVVGHADIAPGRRTDPFGWDWDRFRTMVREQLRPADLEVQRTMAYDRRSLDRRAADEAAASSAATIPLPSLPSLPSPTITPSRAPAPDKATVSAVHVAPPALPRRAAPSSVKRNVGPDPLQRSVGSPKKRGTVLTTPKPVIRSRTVWLNGITVASAAAAIVGESLKMAFGAGLDVPQDVTKWVLFGVGLMNIILRLRTTQPLTCSANAECSSAEPAPTSRAEVPGHFEERAVAGQR